MDGFNCDASCRSEDPKKNVAHISQHHHNEYSHTSLAQLQTFSDQQGNSMDLHLGKHEFPAPSIPVIPLVFMVIFIARKITGHPSGITQLQLVVVGLVLSAISMAVAGIVEVKRRNQSIKDQEHPISLFWLSSQYAIFGIADMLTLVGLLEFFYKEAPMSMKSLSTSFTWLSLSSGYFLSTVFVNIINAITKTVTPSKKGWLHGEELADNNLHLFEAILSCLNFVVYVYSALWYKYKSEDIPDHTNSKPKTMACDNGLLLAKEESNTTTTPDQMISTSNVAIKITGEQEQEGSHDVANTNNNNDVPKSPSSFDHQLPSKDIAKENRASSMH